jgi:beta-lactamase superfamily II metal-dependent hydrolase
MAGKRRRKAKKAKKGNAGKAAAVLVFFAGIFLAVYLGTGGDPANLRLVFDNMADNLGGGRAIDKTAAELAGLGENGDKLIVYAVDTGNSDCLIVRAPGGQSMLVDAADNDDFKNIAGTLRALEIERLDVAVATHPDSDHIGSMDDVVAAFTPAVFYMPDFERNTATYQDLTEQIEKNNTACILVTAPYDFMLGEVEVFVLNPQPKEYADANETSVVLLLRYGGSSALLTGDIETGALEDILSLYPAYLDVDVLKVAHHGSARSTTPELLEATTPKIAVITSGAGNDYGHPHRETIDLLEAYGAEILRTDEQGDIAIFLDGKNVWYGTAA